MDTNVMTDLIASIRCIGGMSYNWRRDYELRRGNIPRGEWEKEPDYLSFYLDRDMFCEIVRHEKGYLQGFITLSKFHPWSKRQQVPDAAQVVHGCISSEEVVEAGYKIGFDCNPGKIYPRRDLPMDDYKDMFYVIQELKTLADLVNKEWEEERQWEKLEETEEITTLTIEDVKVSVLLGEINSYILYPAEDLSDDFTYLWYIEGADRNKRTLSYLGTGCILEDLQEKFHIACTQLMPGSTIRMMLPPRKAVIVNPNNIYVIEKVWEPCKGIEKRKLVGGYYQSKAEAEKMARYLSDDDSESTLYEVLTLSKE